MLLLSFAGKLGRLESGIKYTWVEMGTMDQKQLDDYVKKIEEFVIDEGQIVSFYMFARF